MFGHLDVAQWLVKQGAGVNTETSDKYTPLAISVAKACESNDPRYLALIKWLVSKGGAEPDILLPHLDTTPLYLAVDKGELEIVRALLAAGADPNLAFNRLAPEMSTCLMCACTRGNKWMIELLVHEGGANVQHSAKKNGVMAIHCVAQEGHTACCEWLVLEVFSQMPPSEEAASLAARNHAGMNFLHIAVSRGHTDLVTWICNNTDIDPESVWGTKAEVDPRCDGLLTCCFCTVG